MSLLLIELSFRVFVGIIKRKWIIIFPEIRKSEYSRARILWEILIAINLTN